MGNRLYVGNLSYQLNTEDLKQAFEQVGPVTDAKVMTDRETGQGRGFGFVTMSTEADAKRAIQELNGYALAGRNLRVNEAEDRPARSGGGGGGGGGYRPNGGYSTDAGGGSSRPRVYENDGGGRGKGSRRDSGNRGY
jgi:RNA recognition motif-containing protein